MCVWAHAMMCTSTRVRPARSGTPMMAAGGAGKAAVISVTEVTAKRDVDIVVRRNTRCDGEETRR